MHSRPQLLYPDRQAFVHSEAEREGHRVVLRGIERSVQLQNQNLEPSNGLPQLLWPTNYLDLRTWLVRSERQLEKIVEYPLSNVPVGS